MGGDLCLPGAAVGMQPGRVKSACGGCYPAAAAHNIPTVGVSWGYGTVEDMQNAGAVAIANTMQELLEYLTK